MRMHGGYCCDICRAELVLDIELNAHGAASWASQAQHVCEMCVFGCTADSSDIEQESN